LEALPDEHANEKKKRASELRSALASTLPLAAEFSIRCRRRDPTAHESIDSEDVDALGSTTARDMRTPAARAKEAESG
jgi:hypothetical protein